MAIGRNNRSDIIIIIIIINTTITVPSTVFNRH